MRALPSLSAWRHTMTVLIRCIFTSSSRIKFYTYLLWWSEFSNPSDAPSLQSKILIIPMLSGSRLLSCQSERILRACLFTYFDIWPECLNGICKTVLTQGNSLTIIIIISIFVTGKTDPTVTVPLCVTHTQNIQSKDQPSFKQLTMCVHWKTLKTGSEKSPSILPDLEEEISFFETSAFRFWPDLISFEHFEL